MKATGPASASANGCKAWGIGHLRDSISTEALIDRLAHQYRAALSDLDARARPIGTLSQQETR